MRRKKVHILVVGGSAGSLSTVMEIVAALPQMFDYYVLLVMHRMRNVVSDMAKIMEKTTGKKIREPEDKEKMEKGIVYLAPQNYHLLIEEDMYFSLDYSEPIHYSRPSIDVTFECAADLFRDKTTGILLSGANKDGAKGLSYIIKKGGKGIIQDPETAEYSAMPLAAIDSSKNGIILTQPEIVDYIKRINC